MTTVADEEIHTPTVPAQAAPPSVSLACVLLYLAVVAILLATILHRDDRVFTYTLDDPYIHLALAQSIAHGSYGINPGEPSSPSSSVLWPFLLVPFAAHSWNQYTPLALNLLFCGIAAWLLGRIVDSWPWQFHALPQSPILAWLIRFAAAIALVLAANLAGLTFIGMEHGLQVLLAIACAAGMAQAFAGRRVPTWCLAAAVLAPAVRYEDFALVAAVAITLYGQRRLLAALAVALLSSIAPAVFSLFLISRGLSPLPSSVLVKSKIYKFHGNAIANAFATLGHNIYFNAQSPSWQVQFVLFLLLLWLTLREQERTRRFVLAGAAAAAFLQTFIGQFNWFYRYEVYALVFTVLIAATAIFQSTRLDYRFLLAGLWAFGIRYTQAIYETPTGAANVYQQQYQMHRFLADYYRNTVAVNDLGWISYRRPPGVYVLDLWGLASPVASRQYVKDAAWLDAITRDHNAALAIIYPDWFDEAAPDDWQPLGTMCITSERVSVARDCVVFYNTAVGNHASILAQLTQFARTLPPTVRMTLGADTTQGNDD